MSSPELTVAIRGAQKLCQRMSSKLNKQPSSASTQYEYESPPTSVVASDGPASLPMATVVPNGIQGFSANDLQTQVSALKSLHPDSPFLLGYSV